MTKIRHSLLAALLLVPAAAAAAQAQTAARLTPDGYGAVRIGMTRPQVERALGTALRGEAIEDAAICVEQRAVRGHTGLLFMFEQRRLTRISAVRNARVATPRGIRLGDSEAQVRRAYPRGLETEPHKYVAAPARYLTYWLRPDRGVQFETDARGRVAAIHAGTPSIRYVEGCA